MRTLANLKNSTYPKDVCVDDYMNSFKNIVENNKDAFEFASLRKGSTIAFKFKLVNQPRVTYLVHAPHGRGTNMIPKEYREEYWEAFEKMNARLKQ